MRFAVAPPLLSCGSGSSDTPRMVGPALRIFRALVLQQTNRALASAQKRSQSRPCRTLQWSLHAIEDERKQWFMGFSSSAELVGDARTRVLEELKQWLLTLDEGAPATVASVAARLDYCWQFLLRPGVFETRNERSFLQAMAEVARTGASLPRA